MGEDVADIPPANWHLEIKTALETWGDTPQSLIVDVTELSWLVGQDWGFLVRLADTLEQANSQLVLVANDRVRDAASFLKITDRIPMFESVGDATSGARRW